MSVLALVVAAALLPAPPALAQPPAPAPAAAPAEPPPRFEASAQFAFLGTTGNASTNTLGTGGEAVWRPDKWVYTAKANFAQIESDDEVTARSVVGLFRAARTVSKRVMLYGQYDFLRDVFAGVEQRHIGEAGVSFLAIDQKRQTLQVDTGLGYLHEEGTAGEDFDSATLSLGARYRLAISESSEFTYDPRYLFSFADAGASRYDQTAALAVALNSVLSLKLAHTIRYSAEPPEGFDTVDTITAVSIVARVPARK